jgi:hypothetical protein
MPLSLFICFQQWATTPPLQLQPFRPHRTALNRSITDKAMNPDWDQRPNAFLVQLKIADDGQI